MEKKTYTYGTKLTGVIFHLFFTVVFTIAVFLLAAMIDKNIFSLTDIPLNKSRMARTFASIVPFQCAKIIFRSPNIRKNA